MDTFTRMRTFVEVVDAGGFSAAARAMGKSKALVSKYVRDLEDELGVRLLNRTTRRLSLTEVGQAYHREAADILQRLEDLATSVGDAHREPRGTLRVAAPRSFADNILGQALSDFLAAEPRISLDLHLDDRFVDLVEEGFDVAIRVTEMTDSSLIARRLAPFRVILVASPAFLAAHGTPAAPSDLAGQPAVVDTNSRTRGAWVFDWEGERVTVTVRPRMEANSPEVTLAGALAGLGYARVPEFTARAALADGRLVHLLAGSEPKNAGIYAVYPHRRHLSGKVRAFVDFLAQWFVRADCPNSRPEPPQNP
jgi:DNA-binding transcriptional LysR family regulator